MSIKMVSSALSGTVEDGGGSVYGDAKRDDERRETEDKRIDLIIVDRAVAMATGPVTLHTRTASVPVVTHLIGQRHEASVTR